MNTNTPSYIKSLVTPTAKTPAKRNVWSIDLQNVWLPFFTATNTQGDTAIPAEALGCPLRLAYDKAGSVRFSQAGRPVIRVAKELSDSVKLVKDNFTANLLNYAGSVIRDNAEAYKAQVELCAKAGIPIYQADRKQLDLALQAKAKAEAEAILKASQSEVQPEVQPETVKGTGSKHKAKAENRELVPA